MLEPRYIKEGKLLLKGVKKCVRYKRDLISDERMAKIEDAYATFEGSLKERDPDRTEKLAQELTITCEKSVPEYRGSAWRENVEVIFVAIVIAVGIRAYVLQPFKIPTGSMQPTLNGVVGDNWADKEDLEKPGFLRQAFQYVGIGRNYVNVVAEANDTVVKVFEDTNMKFFTFTKIQCASGKTYTIYAPLSAAMTDLGMQGIFGYLTSDGRPSQQKIYVNQILARGYIDTGDQVLVDKMSYHFRRPKRGEVFVFTTNGIVGITGGSPGATTQHYIKRLAGVPGDELELHAQPGGTAELHINGKLAEEPGFRRVMSRDDGYRGYSFAARRMEKVSGTVYRLKLDEAEYWAMGDNSFHSSDSREWGTVPEQNLVGHALVVYWPFSSHWGFID